ncbi:MAG: TPM domain-containing protein [Muribaculaceae bacterium]
MPLIDFLTEAEQKRIVEAIEAAERRTSGEIRVHVEPKCKNVDPVKRAVEVFDSLRMYETKERNGVLIYVAYLSRKFAIIGDCGINNSVPEGFWDEEKSTMLKHLSAGKAADGICQVIAQVGENLAEYFPWTPDDVNEQSDEISYSE